MTDSRSGRSSFDSKLISLLPLDEVPVHVHPFAARAPCDSQGSECQCGIHRAEAASALRSRKTERAAKENPTPISQFFLAPAAPGTPTRRHALGRLPTPPPLPENLLLRLHRKLPSAPLASSQEVRNPKIGQQLGAQPTPRSINASTNASINASIIPLNPLHALHFLLPTGDSRSGRRSFDSKLISLLPLDEVPVHVHRFAARAPCDSKGSECQCGIHTAEAASALRSRKTERAAKEKPTPISQFFLAPAAPHTPTRRHAPGRLSTPPPLPENLLLGLHKKLPSAPLRAPRRFRNPKIGQQLGAQPTPRFRWRFRWRFR